MHTLTFLLSSSWKDHCLFHICQPLVSDTICAKIAPLLTWPRQMQCLVSRAKHPPHAHCSTRLASDSVPTTSSSRQLIISYIRAAVNYSKTGRLTMGLTYRPKSSDCRAPLQGQPGETWVGQGSVALSALLVLGTVSRAHLEDSQHLSHPQGCPKHLAMLVAAQ